MATIRPMRPEDVDPVRELDSLAFSLQLRQMGWDWSRAMRTRENVLASLALFPTGCFVSGEGKLTGYVFARHWGRIGWVGTFGIDPDRRGEGIGRRLLRAAVDSLEAAGCTTIGLETMAESPYNLGLYARFGFRPVYPTLTLEKEIAPSSSLPHTAVPRTVGELADVRAISESARDGLDYAVECRNALEFGWGQPLLIGEPSPWAVAIVRTTHTHEAPVGPLGIVTMLCIAAAERHRVAEAVVAAEAFAGARGYRRIRVLAPSADWPTLQALLALGFKVARMTARMLLRGSAEAPPGVDCYRWMM